MKKLVLVITMVAFFAAGYLTGSIQTRNSIALELGGLMNMGDTVTSLKNLGTTIIEMEQNVSKLQENINSVKKVRDDVSNYTGVYDQVMGVKKEAPKTQVPATEGVTKDATEGLKDLLK